MRIAFTGRMGSGKSTAAEFLVETYGFKRFSFAQKLKELAAELFGMQGKDRKLLQDLGTVLRGIDNDVWAKYLIARIQTHGYTWTEFGNKRYDVVVDDMRYLNEAKLLREHGFVLVRLICLDEENRLKWLKDKGTLAGQDHPSETEQEKIAVDFEIQWRNIPDLKKQLKSLVKLLSLNPPEIKFSVEEYDVKKDKPKLFQLIVDWCVKKVNEETVSERDRQKYLRILNDCMKTIIRAKELEEITEDDLAQIIKKINEQIPKKWRI